MSEFRIEKVRHAMDITLASGERMTGTVFLESIARTHTGAQDPRELLDDDEPFFPFAVEGRTILLAKDQVKVAKYRASSHPGAVPAPTIAVRVVLADSSIVEGGVEMEARSDADRMLDYLNGFSGRFLSVMLDRSTRCLVNRRMIAGVQQR